MRINRFTGPSGGWAFPVSPNVTIRGDTFEILRNNIYEWRMQNAQEPGNIEAEIDAHFCAKAPERCAPEPKDSQYPPGVTADDKMSDRVLRWVASMVDVRRMPAGGWPMVSLKVAAARAAACAECFRNVDFPSSCSGCDRSIETASSRVRSHRANPLPHTLRACSLFGWHTPSAIHLTDAALGVMSDDERRKLAPAHCPWASLAA